MTYFDKLSLKKLILLTKTVVYMQDLSQILQQKKRVFGDSKK